jgi:hypothetical protein
MLAPSGMKTPNSQGSAKAVRATEMPQPIATIRKRFDE